MSSTSANRLREAFRFSELLDAAINDLAIRGRAQGSKSARGLLEVAS